VAVFALVYLGMMLGSLPPLALDRTGIAVLGAIVLIASGRIGLGEAAVPTVLGLGATWWVIRASVRGRWAGTTPVPAAHDVRFDRWQTAKGLIVLGVVVVLFLVTEWPREIVALGAAGVLLVSRQTASRDTLGALDGQLVLLFMGLFVVNQAFSSNGLPARLLTDAAAHGVDLRAPGALFALTAVLSNVVSNVPAVMLLLPAAAHPQAGAVLALSSTPASACR